LWVMAHIIKDIDPREVITRNLKDAHTAMADGRYTDPPERSAFHYYSTVLALDPDNTDAIEGIDAIADRHLTNARVLLAKHRIAEAGVALEQARRVRPDHNGLAVLDAQWRAELRQILAAATAIAKPIAEPIEKPVIAKTRDTTRDTPKLATPAPEVKLASAALPKVSDVAAVAAALAATRPSTPQQTAVLPIAEPQSAAASGTNVVEEQVAASAPEPTPAVVTPAPTDEPRLIRMVQPQYPQEAMIRGIEGWVEVSLQVSAAGDVIAPRVEDSSRGRMFNRAALAAVEQWKYQPPGDASTSERIRVRLKFQQSK
jgi:TonB family protein